MINKLKQLIFGLNEYEKTKIEDRFFLAKNILLDLSIEKLEDFEILEDINYKIKDEMRIKSSNLNRVIKSLNRNLKIKDVEDFLFLLNKIKSDFLNNAFSVIESGGKEVRGERLEVGEKRKEIGEEVGGERLEVREERKEIRGEEQEVEKKENIDEDVEVNLDENLILFSNDKANIRIENGKIPYILINFFDEVDLVLVKNISSIFFETMSAHGTNIIVESKKVLIIPRFNEDKLFDLPRIQVDIEKVFKRLEGGKRLEVGGERKEESPHPPTSNHQPPYVDIEAIEKPFIKKSLKKKEDSLDSLLNEIDSKKVDLVPPPNPKNDDSKVEFIKDESIEIEKKYKGLEVGGERLEEEKRLKVKGEMKEGRLVVSGNQPPTLNLQPPTSKKKHEVYRDDKVVAYIEENSKVLGELVIEAIDGKKIINFDESQMAYISIFSKIFSGILFEIISAHGTNLIWDFNDNKIRIIPRFDKDNLNNLQWTPKSNTNEFLDQVKNKLISEMGKEVGGKGDGGQRSEVGGEKIEKKQKNKTELEEKAQFVLESLKRIP